jgi:hypothetical protein
MRCAPLWMDAFATTCIRSAAKPSLRRQRSPVSRSRRIQRALPSWNDQRGQIGKADVVEFEPDGAPGLNRNNAPDVAA